MTLTQDQYNLIIDGIKADYEERIVGILREAKRTMEDAGYTCGEPLDMCDDTYRWSLAVVEGPDSDPERSADITIEIAEAQAYGDEPETGINFGLDFVEWGGRIIGQFTPFNFTDWCWVDATDEDAVEERFGYLEQLDLYELSILFGEVVDRWNNS